MFKFSAKFVLLLTVSTNFNVGFLGITQAQAATLLLGISTSNKLLQKVTDNYLSHSHLSKSKTLSSIQSTDRTIKSQSKQENLGVDSKNIVLMLEAALVAQNSFLKLEQTELRFRSRKQQEFYNYIAQLFTESISKIEFQHKVNAKLEQILPLLNSEDGKEALKAYLEELKKVSEHELGLKLLGLFKQYNLADFSILIKISDLVSQMQSKDLLNLKTIVSLVISQYEIFEKLAPIIGVSEDRSTPDNYAKILQYIGLTHRHEVAYGKFQELVVMLKQWQKPYRSIVGIRSEYDPNEYYLPQEFTEEIPGLNIFNKYESYF